MVLNFNDLNQETRDKLGFSSGSVPLKVIVLGRILSYLSGLTKREACWALRNALRNVQVASRQERRVTSKAGKQESKK